MKPLAMVCALVWVLATASLVQADLLASIGQLINPTTAKTHHKAAPHATHKPKKKPSHPLTSPTGTLLTATSPLPFASSILSAGSSFLLPTSLPSVSSITSTSSVLSLATPPASIPPPSTPIVVITSTIPPAPATNGPALAGGLADSSGSNSMLNNWSTSLILVATAIYFMQ